jgi:glycosyltransferase involved in cell wall biosynthesis
MSDDRILFISREASRTGAPILLLHFLRWLKANTTLSFEILLGSDGELRSDFESLAPVAVLGDWQPGWGVAQLAARVRQRQILNRLSHRNYAVIYSNTITNGNILEVLDLAGRPLISHVHELENVIWKSGPRNLNAVKRCTTQYVACAEAVKSNLVENHGIDSNLIEVIHEFIPVVNHTNNPDQALRKTIFNELGILESSLVVGASGTCDWRKAPEVFIQVARAVRWKRPQLDVHFVWVGGDGPGTRRFEELQHDVRALGMEDRIHFIGHKPNPVEYFRVFDVFALVSREDPFPLVCLEAACLQKPIVCFDGAGGEKEFVEDDCGFVVPYLDVHTMADQILRLLESDALRQTCGEAAFKKAHLRHDVNVAAPKLLQLIRRVMHELRIAEERIPLPLVSAPTKKCRPEF